MAEIIKMLKDDHKKVKELFDRFEATDDTEEQRTIVHQALQELEIHSAIENTIVYPALAEETENEESLDEAYEEHHVVELLIAELKAMNGSSGGRFAAKFMVLAENVRHHIKEEESELLPKLERSDADLDGITEEAVDLKNRLMADPSLLEDMKSEDGESGSSRSGSWSGSSQGASASHRTGAGSRSARGGSSRGSTGKSARSTASARGAGNEDGANNDTGRSRPSGARTSTARNGRSTAGSTTGSTTGSNTRTGSSSGRSSTGRASSATGASKPRSSSATRGEGSKSSTGGSGGTTRKSSSKAGARSTTGRARKKTSSSR